MVINEKRGRATLALKNWRWGPAATVALTACAAGSQRRELAMGAG